MGKELDGLRGSALRRSAELKATPDILEAPEFSEAHRRGEVFVAAVMQAFIAAWSKRIKDTGLENQEAFPLASVVEEGADIADALATVWIRALDYMPPVHLTFQDALTAALTSDTQVRPDDQRFKLRHYLKEQFAAFGIQPVAGPRGAQPDCWAPAPSNLRYDRVRFDSMRSDKDEVFRFLWENRNELELQTDAYAKVISVRPCLRTGIDGFVAKGDRRRVLPGRALDAVRARGPEDQRLRASFWRICGASKPSAMPKRRRGPQPGPVRMRERSWMRTRTTRSKSMQGSRTTIL